jgi:hypothetical protein
MSSDRDRDQQLEASLRRVQAALSQGAVQQAQTLQALVQATGLQALDRVNRKLARKLQRRALHDQQRLHHRLLRDEIRRAKHHGEGPGRAQGFVFAGSAVVLAILAITQPHLWWLIFVAFGFSMSAARILSRAHRQPALASDVKSEGALETVRGPATASEPADAKKTVDMPAIDARLGRVNSVCDKLLNEIRTGPQIVRDIVHNPEETVKALRTTCQELGQRERDLRAAIVEADGQRLQKEREELSARIASEKDDIVRSRLESARSALDSQLSQRAELGTAAARLEAESTRILYTLENLHAQILRVRSADSGSADVAGAGLRRSLDQLGSEIDSVAEALEEVNRSDAKVVPSPVVDVAEPVAQSASANREKV